MIRRTVHDCAARGCTVRVGGRRLWCRGCERFLPLDLQARIRECYIEAVKHGEPWRSRHRAAIDAARAVIQARKRGNVSEIEIKVTRVRTFEERDTRPDATQRLVAWADVDVAGALRVRDVKIMESTRKPGSYGIWWPTKPRVNKTTGKTSYDAIVEWLSTLERERADAIVAAAYVAQLAKPAAGAA